MTFTSPYSVVDLDTLGAGGRSAAREVLERCQSIDGRPPLGDHALSALAQVPPSVGCFAVLAPSGLVAYAQATPTIEALPTWTIDVAIDPLHRHDAAAILDAALGAAVAWVRPRDAASVQWWCRQPTDIDHDVAERHGLLPRRQLLEMHVDVRHEPERSSLRTRSFVEGLDEQSLLEVNNLAFATHPDQGNWTLTALQGRFASEWFEPAGLLLHFDAHGTMLGFCWTKIHGADGGRNSGQPDIGEIYVLAVHPDHGGRGLGRALAVAGLQSLAARNVRRVMLFVDGGNTAALSVYRQIGFEVTSTTIAFQANRRPDGGRGECAGLPE